MNVDQIAGILALGAQGIAAAGWSVVAWRKKQAAAVWLACGFVLLWVPVVIRMCPGDVYTLDGRRIVTSAHVISRMAYAAGFVCLAASAIVAVRGSKKQKKSDTAPDA